MFYHLATLTNILGSWLFRSGLTTSFNLLVYTFNFWLIWGLFELVLLSLNICLGDSVHFVSNCFGIQESTQIGFECYVYYWVPLGLPSPLCLPSLHYGNCCVCMWIHEFMGFLPSQWISFYIIWNHLFIYFLYWKGLGSHNSYSQ